MSIIASYIVPHPPLIIAEVGKGEERKIQKTVDSYHAISREIAALKPSTIVFISPHATAYGDYFHIASGKEAYGDFAAFGAGRVALGVAYDEEFIQKLSEQAQLNKIYAGTMGAAQKKLDHGITVPLYFINQSTQNYKAVVLSVSGFSYATHYEYGKCIAQAADALSRNVVIVASGDLSHRLKAEGPYGFTQEGVEFDKEITQAMAQGDFKKFMTFEEDLASLAGECGLRSFIIMAGALDNKTVKPKLYSYEGPFGVGYAVASYKVITENEQ